ncbi:hypothetical protein VH12019_00202 [Vibrio phage VH1_2019]|uniref:Uncharacterized protein n=1 Tax=Vibrio phage VH1_2019 TaxID=2686307 RepID=A0A6B9SZ67_9CAUD|nr:hypothetical protein VH12019_00202 [Vibrio phage VH1_2019]
MSLVCLINVVHLQEEARTMNSARLINCVNLISFSAKVNIFFKYFIELKVCFLSLDSMKYILHPFQMKSTTILTF